MASHVARLSILQEALSPLLAVLNPRGYFSRLRSIVDRYGLYGVSVVYFGSWLGVSVFTFLLILAVEVWRGFARLSISSLVSAPARAFLYSFGFPLVAALLDAFVIIILLVPFPRQRPLYSIFAIRASSLLPYSLRVIVLEYQGRLDLLALVGATTSSIGLALLFLGAFLTAYGVRKSMGVSFLAASISALGPLAYKLVIGFM